MWQYSVSAPTSSSKSYVSVDPMIVTLPLPSSVAKSWASWRVPPRRQSSRETAVTVPCFGRSELATGQRGERAPLARQPLNPSQDWSTRRCWAATHRRSYLVSAATRSTPYPCLSSPRACSGDHSPCGSTALRTCTSPNSSCFILAATTANDKGPLSNRLPSGGAVAARRALWSPRLATEGNLVTTATATATASPAQPSPAQPSPAQPSPAQPSPAQPRKTVRR